MRKNEPSKRVRYLFGKISNLQKFIYKHANKFNRLTPREIEVLTMVAGGKVNPAIASELHISRATVQNHRASIRKKLSITSQVDYIKYALAFGLIDFIED